MTKLIDIKCPKCSAPVPIAADATTVSCRYCGGTSAIERGQPVAARPAATAQAPRSGAVVAAITVAVTLSIGVALVTVLLSTRNGGAGPVRGAAGNVTVAGGKGLSFSDRPMLADVNADGVLDLLGKARGPDMVEFIAAYNGKDGAELWRTEALTKDAAAAGQTLRGVVLGRMVSVDSLGKVQAYDLRSGTPSWSALLGEQARAICEGEGTIVIATTDDQRHGLDPTTGKRRELAKDAPCAPVFSSDRDTTPDYRIVDWTQMKQLGLPEMDDIEGLTAHRALVPGGPGPRFMLGKREKGSAVAMVAAVDPHKKLLWKDVVPGVDPLSTDVNVLGIEAAVIDGKLVVPYTMKDKDAGTRVACFAAATGERLWDVQALPKDSPSYGLAVSPERVFITSWFAGSVALSLQTGALEYRIGG